MPAAVHAKVPTLIALWLCLLGVLVFASVADALTAALLWSAPGALLATLLAQALNSPRHAWLAALAGLCWQLALLVAYLPVQSWTSGPPASEDGGASPVHLLAVGAVLLVLVLGFLGGFVLPGLGLRREVQQCRLTLENDTAPMSTLIARLLDSGRWLRPAWMHYQGARIASQAREAAGAGAQSNQAVDPRDFFEPGMLLRMALRSDFFRNLPGMLTGIGIIGTFTGLIVSLRGFDVSGDTREQVSLLVRHVGEAFLASAAAVTLAVLVNVIEKLLSAGLERELELLIALLRLRAGLEPQANASKGQASSAPSAAGDQRVNASAPAAGVAAALMPATHAQTIPTAEPAAVGASSAPALAALGEPAHPPAFEAMPQAMASVGAGPVAGGNVRAATADATVLAALQRSMEAQRAATESLNQLSRAMTESLNQHLSMQTANNQQIMLLSKQMGSRLESALASQEAQQKKLLESMSARLVQSDMKLMDRHRSDTETLTALVRRIEVLISLVRADQDRRSIDSTLFDGHSNEADASPAPLDGLNIHGLNGGLGFGHNAAGMESSTGFDGGGEESFGSWDGPFGNSRPKGRFEP
jgi:uncharacterized membrane protein YgcG